MKRFYLFFVFFVGFKNISFAQVGERRLALVIGIDKYKEIDRNLNNPTKDADTMSYYLQKCQFEVMKAENTDLNKLTEVVFEFLDKMKDYDTGCIFFAGHGLNLEGNNYWMPSGYGVHDTLSYDVRKILIPQNCFSINLIETKFTERYERSKSLIIFSDACRDNPLDINRSVNTNIWSVNAVPITKKAKDFSTVITCFSTYQGHRALDNSPFINSIKKNILIEGQNFDDFWLKIKSDVMRKSGQEPQRSGEIRTDFCFIPKKTEPITTNEGIVLTQKGGDIKPVSYGTSISPTNVIPANEANNNKSKTKNTTTSIKKADYIMPIMVSFRSDTFTMGVSKMIEGITMKDELPAHKEKVNAFEIGQSEVTNEEYCLFLNSDIKNTEKNIKKWLKLVGVNGDEKCRIRQDEKSKKFVVEKGYEKHPIIFISWYGAKAYCDWLSKKTKTIFRLPYEKEWEYAAGNGGEPTMYSWGNDKPIGKKGGNIADKSTSSRYSEWKSTLTYSDNFEGLAPINSFEPTTFQLYDMIGNVAEWCEDWKKPYPKSEDTRNYTNMCKAIRGGGWNRNLTQNRVAFRLQEPPTAFSGSIGFRVAVEVKEDIRP
jgi:formylglycine-generating enzyme required for sulfatase activity